MFSFWCINHVRWWLLEGDQCWLRWVLPGPNPNWLLSGVSSLGVCTLPVYIPWPIGFWSPAKRLLCFVIFPLLARIDLWLAKPDLSSGFAGPWMCDSWGYRLGGLHILLLGDWTLNFLNPEHSVGVLKLYYGGKQLLYIFFGGVREHGEMWNK